MLKVNNFNIFCEGMEARSQDDSNHEYFDCAVNPYRKGDVIKCADWDKGYFWVDKREDLELISK